MRFELENTLWPFGVPEVFMLQAIQEISPRDIVKG